MAVAIILTPGEDPRVFDVVTDEEITHHVYKIEILPGKQVLVHCFAANDDDKHYFDEATRKVTLEPFPREVRSITGEWSR